MIAAFVFLCGLAHFSRGSSIKDHGIVYPNILEARGDNGEKLLRINNDITLKLMKSEIFAGDFLFISEKNGEEVHYYMKQEDYEKNLYHDDEKMASVLFDTDGGINVEGIISQQLRIKPMREMARLEDGTIPHQLYSVDPPVHNHSRLDYGFPGSTLSTIKEYVAEERSSRGTQYVEIHVVADYEYSKAFGFDKAKLTYYFAVFFNACNLRYKTISQLRIRLRLVGITMSETENSYIVRPKGRPEKALDEETLAEFMKYYKDKQVYQTADLFFLITGEDLTFYQNGKLETWTGGYTYIGGVCQDFKVGLSEDYPTTFYNVYTVSHEIGHSLGCVHDGSGAVNELPGHRGSTHCNWDEGYIMSYNLKDKRQYTFSQCCQMDMVNLLSQTKWGCLKRRLHKSIKRKEFPGQGTSGENYCKKLYTWDQKMHYDREYGVQNCQVCCRGEKVYFLKVPDGTPCDKYRTGEKRCFLGECKSHRKRE